ncbi:hypothetical protein BV22DRAFT_625454 [Leucogyrophana mollusca]|uniref:Uncharacterized protein n=1 Tax=Leucogyrophana mollusca TaxID=85980 RepID=A0ACB8BAQ8_9AGAM|nr:hypothetical protein BV22DRAFT_625454 [Leucogyrophana mollusca]
MTSDVSNSRSRRQRWCLLFIYSCVVRRHWSSCIILCNFGFTSMQHCNRSILMGSRRAIALRGATTALPPQQNIEGARSQHDRALHQPPTLGIPHGHYIYPLKASRNSPVPPAGASWGPHVCQRHDWRMSARCNLPPPYPPLIEARWCGIPLHLPAHFSLLGINLH